MSEVYFIINLFIQIAIVRLTTHNHQEEQDLDEAEVIYNVGITSLSTIYTVTSFSAKMYRFEKVFLIAYTFLWSLNDIL